MRVVLLSCQEHPLELAAHHLSSLHSSAGRGAQAAVINNSIIATDAGTLSRAECCCATALLMTRRNPDTERIPVK